MNTMKWLVKREFWEHKGGFFWTPAVVGLIMTLFLAVTVVVALTVGKQHGIHINGTEFGDLSSAMSAEDKTKAVAAMTHGYMSSSAPLFMVLAFVVFFFSLGSLFDERKDRSVLFWKSLPVSDGETVLAKVAMALVVAPLITLVFATITSLLSLIILTAGGAAGGLNLFGAILSSPAVYAAPFQVLAILPVYVVWALPTVGWLMMVSAWARTKPFLWAVGAPLLVGALLSWFDAMFGFHWNISWFWQHIIGRGLASVVPGSWFAFVDPTGGFQVSQVSHDNGPNLMIVVAQSWKVLATADAWIGAAIGSAMIFAAVRLRRWKDEG